MRDKIIQSFNFRHACKTFDNAKKINQEDFALIMECARLSPSSFGFEPWNFFIVEDIAFRMSLLEHFWGGRTQFPSADKLVFILARKAKTMRADSEYIEHIMADIQNLPKEIRGQKKMFYKNFQDNDFALQSDRALTDWSIRQCYIPLTNMMTVASLLGIDSCPMEGFTRDIIDERIGEELGVDMNIFTLAVAVAFGYRKVEPRVKTRQAMKDIIFVNK